jgi:hypothetical protein
MTRANLRRLVIALLLVLSVAVPGYAQQFGAISPEAARCIGPTGEWMIADTFLMRPAGIAAMGVGAAMSVVMFPFAAMSNSVNLMGQRMFVEPFEFTFRRPLGDLDYGCDQDMLIK